MKLFSWFKRNEPDSTGNSQENFPLEAVSVNKSNAAPEETERWRPIYDENEPIFTPVGRDGRFTWIRTMSRPENERREKLYNERIKLMNKNDSIQEEEISEVPNPDSEQMVLRPEIAETVSIDSSYSSYDAQHSPGSSFNFNIFYNFLTKKL